MLILRNFCLCFASCHCLALRTSAYLREPRLAKTGKRRNLSAFPTRQVAEKHERAVQYQATTCDSEISSSLSHPALLVGMMPRGKAPPFAAPQRPAFPLVAQDRRFQQRYARVEPARRAAVHGDRRRPPRAACHGPRARAVAVLYRRWESPLATYQAGNYTA
jgi:hypothetical protein